MRAELFQADGRTNGQMNMTKLIATFRNFGNAPKKEQDTYTAKPECGR